MMRYVLYLLAFFLPWVAAHAEVPRLESTANARLIRDYARITFEWPQPVYLSASAQGSTLIIDFERPVKADTQKVLASLAPYLKSATAENGGKRLRIEMTKAYPVRSFVSEQISGVDILDIKKGGKAVAQPAPAKKPEKHQAVAAPVKPMTAKKLAELMPAAGEAPTGAAPKTDAEAVAETAAARKVEAQASELAAAAAPTGTAPKTDAEAIAERATTKKAPAPVAPVETATPAPIAAKEAAPVVAESPVAPAPVVAEAPVPATTPESAAPVVATAEPTPPESAPAAPAVVTETSAAKLQADIAGELVNLTIPWKERVAAAGFTRHKTMWMVFNREIKFDLDEANLVLQPNVKIEQLPVKDATVLLIRSRTSTGMAFQLVEGTFDWQVVLSPNTSRPEAAMEVATITEVGLPAHVLVSALETADKAIRVKDPNIGDTLLVMPMYSAGKGMVPERKFIDFKLLTAWQGLVVQAIADDTTMLPVRNGIRIATDSGARISADLPPVEAGAFVQAKMDVNAVLFPYTDWKTPEGTNYQNEVDRLVRAVARDRGTVGAVSKYHRAAQIYLSEGRAAEAIGMLQMAKRMDPEYYIDKRMSAMEGAANFLMQRYQEAFTLFNTQELEFSKEAIFWRSMLSEILGTPNQNFNFEEHYTHFISKYPPLMRQRLAILAADRAIASKDYNTALKIFDQLNTEQVIGEVADYVNYLMGTISVANKQVKDGYAIWQKLLEQPGREFVKTRAEFAWIAERYARGETKDAETIDKLERLALRWRGDVLELNVLKLLSSIYQKQKDWPNALRVWKALNDGFPNTTEAVNASRNMDDAFHAMFDRGEVGTLSMLDQLFLFHEYRDLLTDNEIGDRIAEKVVSKMVALDLLDEASDLLEKRMKNRFERDARSNTGAQLARLYLLNKQPLKALYALQDSVYGQNPTALTNERTMLAVQAMIDLNRYEDALSLIANDKTADADLLRSEVYWRQKDWPMLNATLEGVLRNREDANKPVTSSEANHLIRLALGYRATKEPTQSQYLRDYFTPLMADSTEKKLFEFLTQPDIPVTPDTFDKSMHQLDETLNFFHSYKWGKAT
jgi:tetratricopeptide (TPR) repeat protein